MAHQRRQPNRVVRADAEESCSLLDDCTDTHEARRRADYSCTICSLIFFGLLMATSGALLGMYYKAEIIQAYTRTAGHIDRLSAADIPRQAAQTLSKPFRKAVIQSEFQKYALANAATELEGRQLSASWALPWVNKSVCDDSCPSSKNRRCNDGRSGEGEVLCDLGTDCSDCGPWKFQVPTPDHTIPKPVQLLREHRTTINVAQTATNPPFLMPYTSPEQDTDVSAQMHASRVVELGLTQAWYKTLGGRCKKPNGEAELVLDIGANFGYYTFYAIRNGCRVVAWEPVPIFRAFLEYGLQVNNMTQSVRVRKNVVSDKPGKEYELTVPLHGIWGTASIDGQNIDEVLVGAHREKARAIGERVDALIHEDSILAKVDVEGFEPSAFESMKGMFDSHRIGAIFMEYSPGVYEHTKKWDRLEEMPHMLTYLLEHGYTILHINDSLARGVPLLKQPDWAGTMPPLEEVTAANLAHDLEDAKKLQSGILGCYSPEELVRTNRVWEHCNALPEDLHPKGFRGTFGHNTNIWASLEREALAVGEPVGIQAPDQPVTDWYGKNPAIGMGGRLCDTITPDKVLLRHRCPCLKASCRDEALLVKMFAQQGQMQQLSNRDEEGERR